MSKLYFKEVQRFNQWYILVLNVITFAIVVFFITKEIIHLQQTSQATNEAYWLLLIGLIPLLLILLFYMVKLETEIRKEGIYFRFKPFQRKFKFYDWKDILKFYVRKYKPIKEYGGWGVRAGTKKYGRAYNVSGNMGLQIELTNGKKILIGTVKATELERAITKIKKEKESI
jgi:hypothetical protein